MTHHTDEIADIQFKERDGYLRASFSGKCDSLAISTDCWQQSIDECRKRGFKKLLVEEDFPNQLSMHEIYTLIEAIRKMLTFDMQIAFIDTDSEQAELNLFGETVAINRGITGKVFNDRTNAEAWLKA